MTEEWILRDSRPAGKVMHPSTLLGIEALQGLKEKNYQFTNILDMGCGSGLLSLIAGRFWANARITCVDISEMALRECNQNLTFCNLQERALILRNEGYAHPRIEERGPYDLIISNLLAELHVRYAQDALNRLSMNGIIILSGILEWLDRPVIESYAQLKFESIDNNTRQGWTMHKLKKH